MAHHLGLIGDPGLSLVPVGSSGLKCKNIYIYTCGAALTSPPPPMVEGLGFKV